MSDFFALLHFVALVCFIVFLVKMIKQRKNGEDNSKSKKLMLISAAAWVVALALFSVTTPNEESIETEEQVVVKEESEPTEASVETSTETKENTSSTEEPIETPTETKENTNPTPETSDFEVSLDVNAHKDGNSIIFDIETNMPDETELMLTLSKGDYNTDDSFTAQDKVTIANGKAASDEFSNGGEVLSGDFDLSISMSLPGLQSDNVRAVIGENGEHMTGKFVEFSSIGSANTIKAMFNVSIGDNISVAVSDGYNNTIFREEIDEEPIETESSETESDEDTNKEFIARYETDIVVAAEMTLDNFISGYKLSLAPQKWTIAKFDSSETTVIAISDIKYGGEKGTYIYVGTLNINDSGKVESATPHYLEVNGVVLGDDGYCDDVFDQLRALGN